MQGQQNNLAMRVTLVPVANMSRALLRLIWRQRGIVTVYSSDVIC